MFSKLPAEATILRKIIKACNPRLKKILQESGSSLKYASENTKEFAQAVWSAVGKYFVNFSKCELPYWLAPLIRGNRAFTKPGKRDGEEVEEKNVNLFSNSKERKTKIAGLIQDHPHLAM